MNESGMLSMFELFRDEVRAHAATLNQGLIELEGDAGNARRIEPLMRAAHSIKGAARIVDIDAVVQLAHVMEDVFVAAQSGRIRIASADIDVLLRGADLLGSLEQLRENSVAAWVSSHRLEIDQLKTTFAALAVRPVAEQPVYRSPVAPQPEAISIPEQSLLAVRLVAEQPVYSSPVAPQPDAISIPEQSLLAGDDYSMLDVFREEVRIHGIALRDGLTELETGRFEARLISPLLTAARGIKGASHIVGLTAAGNLAAAMESALTSAEKGAGVDLAVLAGLWQATALLVGAIPIGDEELSGWLAQREAEIGAIQARLRGTTETVVLRDTAVPETVRSTTVSVVREEAPPPTEVPLQPPSTAAAPTEPPEAVVRVSAQSLNRLIGLAGESLVQARWLQPFSSSLMTLRKQHDQVAILLNDLAQTLAEKDGSNDIDSVLAEARAQTERCRQVLDQRVAEFEDHSARAEDLNTRLYREVIVSRMRPFSDGAHSFPRLVRDAARRLEKQVVFEMHGQGTEVDRDILEKLEAPLAHLLRNAVDHGMETPVERLKAGKPETGRIKIETGHRAGMLAVTVSDDGRGIDPARLRAKIVDKGLTTAAVAQTLSEAELLEFLFLPGFSTASALTEFSGRGVGLDVVQTMVRAVGGSVRITTAVGKGTSFHLKLPLTLSVLRAVLVEIAGEPYAFPHNRIDRLLRVSTNDIRSLQHRHFTIVDGQNVGLVLAAQILELPASPLADDTAPVLLLSDQTGQYGLIVDRFRGEQDLVVRPLDPRLGKVPNVSAAAILDDGSPVLIADVEDMVRSMDRFIQTGALLRCDREPPKAAPRKRVLVVDDSITVREVERQLLRTEGYDVDTAVDGQDGLNLARSAYYDLIISDVDMPRLNGLQMVEALRKDDRLRNLPVIIVSYKEREEDRLRGLQAGANAYLTKSSFHDNTFLRTVKDLIGGP